MIEIMAVSNLIYFIVVRFNDMLGGVYFAPSSDCCSNEIFSQLNVNQMLLGSNRNNKGNICSTENTH